jgi:colanic acid biosynthesis protein WcaH
MTIKKAVRFLDNNIPDKTVGLPEDIFLFISRVTPLVNVDLLVKDKKGRTLLSWRDDEYSGKGWHIPGSIVRFKETLEQRIIRCSKQELGTVVTFDSNPISINQLIIHELDNRAHYVSFLYKCYVPEDYKPDNINRKKTDPGYLEWHDHCPDNIITAHEIYRKFILSVN